MATMFWRLLGREAGKSLQRDHNHDEDGSSDSSWSYSDDGGECYISPNIPRCIDKSIDEPISETMIQEAAIRVDDEYYSSPDIPHSIDIGIKEQILETMIQEHQYYKLKFGSVSVQEAVDKIQKQIFETVIHEAATRVADKIGKLPPVKEQKTLGPYSWEQKILLVGEGDFSFSASLAVAFGDARNMIATSLDSFEFLKQNYAKAENNILELKSKNHKVMHGVNARKMAKHPRLHSLKFDCIVYNFPHAGFSNRNASREAEIRKHQKLVRGFLRNAKKMIKQDGQIHITHKCIGFFREWNLEMLGLSHGLRLVEESPFNKRDYPGYKTKYGYGGDANFDWKPAKTYKFQLAKKKRTKKNQK